MSLNKIKNLGKKLGLKFQDKGGGIYQLWESSGFAFIEFKHIFTYLNSDYIEDYDKTYNDEINKNEYFVSLKIIYRSWHVSNDRTDVNDIISIIIAMFLRVVSNSSFRIIDIEHPVIEDELYGRELIPIQSINNIVDVSNKNQWDKIEKLSVWFITTLNMLCTFFNCSDEIVDEYNNESDSLCEWVKKISKGIELSNCITYNSRSNPEWFYYKDANISVVKNESISSTFFRVIHDNSINIIEGINGKLLIEKDMKNYLDYNIYEKAKMIFKNLEDSNEDYLIVPLDNIMSFIGEEHIVFIKGNYNFDEFVKEKELIKQRHIRESSTLFKESSPKILISSQEDSVLFENLILDLLKRESYIFWAKKVALTNEADNGRDLICKFNLKHKNQTVKEDEIEVDYKKLIVQCKTNFITSKKQSIGKSDVDIADTIFDYKPDGYMIVTNTQLTVRLTEYLETIEERENIYIDWWNKEDIEERLIRYPELVSKYDNIISSYT